jgi:hypothetical protein
MTCAPWPRNLEPWKALKSAIRSRTRLRSNLRTVVSTGWCPARTLPPFCSRASGDRLIGAAAQIGLICARPAWLTLLTDVSALPRVARLGIMQDVFRWSVVVHTRIVPPTGCCRPLRRCRAEASVRTCCCGRVLGQHCCPDPAAYRPATRAVLASSCAPDSRGLPHAVGRTRTSGRPRRALPAKCLPGLGSLGLSRG